MVETDHTKADAPGMQVAAALRRSCNEKQKEHAVAETDHTKADTPNMQIRAGVGDSTQSKELVAEGPRTHQGMELGPERHTSQDPIPLAPRGGGTAHSSALAFRQRLAVVLTPMQVSKIPDGPNPACSHARWGTYSVRQRNATTGGGQYAIPRAQYFPPRPRTYWARPIALRHPPSDGEEEVTGGGCRWWVIRPETPGRHLLWLCE
jgi:hypothetical protein